MAEGKAAATIAGAPVSWIAVIGAILGATSIVPVFFFAQGGAYIALMQLLSPLAGLILGPIPGFIAALIGVVIACGIAPASIGGGIIYAPLYATFPLWAGWMLQRPKARGSLVMIAYTVIGFTWYNIVPYVWPGPAGGFPHYPMPDWIIYSWWFILGLILICSPFSWYYMARGVRSKSWKTRLFTLLWLYVLSQWAYHPFTQGFMAYAFAMPPSLQMFIVGIAIPFQHSIISVGCGILGMAILDALKKSGLRRIPGTCWFE